MDLILWRHAEAEDSEPDLERALTGKGQKQARRMAEWLDGQLPDACKILVSPARRTLQTVEPLGRKFKVAPELGPGAAPQDILRAVNWPNGKEAMLVVGHQPTLGQVAALLICGRPQAWDIKKGSAWWIVQRDPGDPDSLYVKAVIGPEQILK